MKVLILSATTGGGHMTAANALKEYIISQNSDTVVGIFDTLEYVSPFLNKAVTGGYVYMAKNTPKMYGSIYKNADKSSTTINKTVEITTSLLKNKLLPLLSDFDPDIVITTHPFAAEIVAGLKNHGIIDLPIINIVTDFAIHQAYISDGIDAYIVSSREMVDQVVQRGVERVRIYPYGIPVKQGFFKDIDRAETFAAEGLDPDIPTILIMAGSFGVTDILKIYHKIVKSSEDFQIIVITGKNEKLYDTFDRYLRKITINNTFVEIKGLTKPKSTKFVSKHKKPAKPTKLLYYTNEVEKYMHMADLIVTKPGGLTVSESIASGLPMAIFKAIPGQEAQNAEFLIGKNMAIRIEKNNSCTAKITDLLQHPDKLQLMKQSIQSFSKGNSAANIYLLMLDLLEKYKNKNSN
ncbi:MAG: galactosyldiacylglycerol synthase [Clostridia bacterium]|nr:galactosyldiacylglycerol synthase [Clostridia bacterium]